MKIDILKSVLDKMVNKELWAIIGGEGTGSVISLEIGRKFKRDRAITNIHLSNDARLYEGEFCIFIECSWKVLSAKKVICTWKDSNKKNGPMLKGLDEIMNQRIKSIKIIDPSLDLIIVFENEKSLVCFCDEPDEDPDNTDYLIFSQDNIYGIGPRSKITVEQRKK